MIACLCSHGFVEYLEVIDVGEQQRVISSRFAAYARVHALQTIHEHAAVRQAREQVVEEVVLKLLLGVLALGDVAVDDDQLRDFALGVTNQATPLRGQPYLGELTPTTRMGQPSKLA